ncbi:MAG TPA: substrate-binding domain-containing protein [Allocoleopsis sp.]
MPQGIFNYGGSTTFAPIRVIVDPEMQKSVSGFQLKYVHPQKVTPGSGKGIEMLLTNKLHFSQSSRPLKEEEKEQNLAEINVGIDGIVFAVHPSLNIPGLTVQQIKDIYPGQITNWQEVGRQNLKIQPYSRRPEDGGNPEYFFEQFLEKKPFGKNAELAYNTTMGIHNVAKEPGGIYYASAAEIIGQCAIKPLPIGENKHKFVTPYKLPYIKSEDCPKFRNKLNIDLFRNGEYPKTRQLYVIIKKNGQIEEEVGRNYANLLLTQAGQNLLEKAGFVKVNK